MILRYIDHDWGHLSEDGSTACTRCHVVWGRTAPEPHGPCGPPVETHWHHHPCVGGFAVEALPGKLEDCPPCLRSLGRE